MSERLKRFLFATHVDAPTSKGELVVIHSSEPALENLSDDELAEAIAIDVTVP